jgi:hypothetical protein
MAQQSLFGGAPSKTKAKKIGRKPASKPRAQPVHVNAYTRKQGRLPKRHPAGTRRGGQWKKGG